jgi:SAM-dependent methyltransferase
MELIWPRRLRLAERFPPPAETFSAQYGDAHRAFIREALDNPRLQRVFAGDRRLPPGYGIGLDERVIELPWALTRLRGDTLDAGSSFNHDHVLDRVLPQVRSLQIVTAAPEAHAFPERGIGYVYADFRDLPFDTDAFETIACVSSLEHVGMDNSLYGGPGREPDPDAAVAAAVDELVRVLAPGGSLLITVPFGASEDHGWFRQFGARELEALQDRLREHGLRPAVSVFAYGRDGWQRSSATAAAELRYRDWHADPAPVADLAAAARGVACLQA